MISSNIIKYMHKNVVYHASKTQGLTALEPRESTHKKKWVYATKDIVTSAMFLGDNFDFICQTGVENGKPHIYEQFEGAFQRAYGKKIGSIYKLNAANFKSGKTSWSAEVISEKVEPVLQEIKIDDVAKFLLQLEKEGKLEIYKYPNKPNTAPKDKSDLVEKAARWTIDFGDSTLEQVRRYHPDILQAVLRRIDTLKKSTE